MINFPYLYADQVLEKKATEITKNIYGPLGLKVNEKEEKAIEQLLYHCLSATAYQQKQIAEKVTATLLQQLNTVNTEIETLQQEQKTVAFTTFYKKFLLKAQIDHLQEFSSFIQEKITLLNRLKHAFSTLFGFIISFTKRTFGYAEKQAPISIDVVAQEILDYISFERETILYNYQNALMFFVAQKKTPLPSLINFWDSQELQEKIIKRSRRVTPVEVQFAEALISFALQGLVMGGGEFSMQMYGKENQDLFKQYQKKQTDIRNDFDNFQKNLQKDQKDITQNLIAAFGEKQNELNKQYNELDKNLREELVYLNQSINLDQPIQHFLTPDFLIFDKYFATSSMYTPRPARPWYNPFNSFLAADWEFDSGSNSFWQNALVAMPEKLYWKQPQEEKQLFTQDPSLHSIFTEYVTKKSSYEIEIECTLINCTYPFFVGIIFNRGRWISGDPERLWWYRLCGLYGTEQIAGDPKSRTISLRFAQQILSFSSDKKEEKETIISPLEQIIDGKNQQLNYSLSPQDTAFLAHNPLKLVFTISTQPNAVSCVLKKKEENGSLTLLYNGSVSRLDPYIYRYHGIGFMAIGCQAEFKIKKPEDLVYTDQELKDFREVLKKNVIPEHL
jgi:hypothetical protein